MLIGTTRTGFHRVECPAAQSMNRAERPVLHTYPDGSRAATVWGSLAGARSWEISRGSLQPDQASLLRSFAEDRGWYATGPVGFVPAGGDRVNLLTEAEANLTGLDARVDAVVPTVDGPVFGQLLTGSETVKIAEGIPLPLTGVRSVVVSAYALGPTKVSVTFRDGAGGSVARYSITWAAKATFEGESPRMSQVFRHAETVASVRQRARSFDLEVQGAVTRPAATLGTELMPWGPGQRAASVMVTETGVTTQWAGHPGIGTFEQRSWRIDELR